MRTLSDVISRLLWAGCACAALLAGGLVVLALTLQSAPQQGAVGALAAVVAIAPYTLARAFDELRRP